MNTANDCNLLTMLSNLIHAKGDKYKQVTKFLTEDEVTRFVTTLFGLSNVGRYETMVMVKGIPFPISSYTVDGRIGSTFMWPRAVYMVNANPLTKDMLVHQCAEVLMTPAEFVDFQHEFFNKFKVNPSLQPVDEFIRPKLAAELIGITNGTTVHVDDVVAVKSLPVQLKLLDGMFEDAYFSIPLPLVIDHLVTNFFTEIKR